MQITKIISSATVERLKQKHESLNVKNPLHTLKHLMKLQYLLVLIIGIKLCKLMTYLNHQKWRYLLDVSWLLMSKMVWMSIPVMGF